MKKAKKTKETQTFQFDLNDYRLTRNDKKVLQFHLENPELKQIEIARLLKLNESTMSQIFNKPAFKKAKSDFSRNALEIINQNKQKAALTLIELLDSESESIKLKVATEILKTVLENKPDEDLEDEGLFFEGWD